MDRVTCSSRSFLLSTNISLVKTIYYNNLHLLSQVIGLLIFWMLCLEKKLNGKISILNKTVGFSWRNQIRYCQTYHHCISLFLASENREMPVNLISFHMNLNFPSWIQLYNQTKPPTVWIEWVTWLFYCHPWDGRQFSIIPLSNRGEKVISSFYTRQASPFYLLLFWNFVILPFILPVLCWMLLNHIYKYLCVNGDVTNFWPLVLMRRLVVV